jgi:hypothetical protein
MTWHRKEKNGGRGFTCARTSKPIRNASPLLRSSGRAASVHHNGNTAGLQSHSSPSTSLGRTFLDPTRRWASSGTIIHGTGSSELLSLRASDAVRGRSAKGFGAERGAAGNAWGLHTAERCSPSACRPNLATHRSDALPIRLWLGGDLAVRPEDRIRPLEAFERVKANPAGRSVVGRCRVPGSRFPVPSVFRRGYLERRGREPSARTHQPDSSGR